MIIQVGSSILFSCKEGNKQAFAELFKSYEKYLFNLCMGYTGNEYDALDLVQETFIKVYRNFDKYDIDRPFHPWIRKVAVNTCLNFKRERKRNIISLNAFTQNNIAIEEIIASDEDLESEIEKIDLERIIKNQMKALSDKQKMVITLRYFEDLSYAEIAKTMDQPIGTVKTDLYRARNVLKENLSYVLEE